MPRDWNRTPPSPPFCEILDNDVCTALSSLTASGRSCAGLRRECGTMNINVVGADLAASILRC